MVNLGEYYHHSIHQGEFMETGTVCVRPFNHLPFFGGAGVAGLLVWLVSYVFHTSPPSASLAKGVLLFLCLTFLIISILAHIGHIRGFVRAHKGYPYAPTDESQWIVGIIQVLIFSTIGGLGWYVFNKCIIGCPVI